MKDPNLKQETACQELEITRATLSACLNEHSTPDGVLFAKVLVKFEMRLDRFEGRLLGIGSGRRLDDPQRPWKSGALTMQGRDKERTEAAKKIEFLGHSIRTERYRYIEWDDGKQGIELFDHELDPWKQNNLAGSSKTANVEAGLSERLRSAWKSLLP